MSVTVYNIDLKFTNVIQVHFSKKILYIPILVRYKFSKTCNLSQLPLVWFEA